MPARLSCAGREVLKSRTFLVCAGFVEDVRRMNVGITRASHALWLLGNARTLSVNEHWRALMEDARARGCVIESADAAELFPKAYLWRGPGAPPPRHINGAAGHGRDGGDAEVAQGQMRASDRGAGSHRDTPPPPPPLRLPSGAVRGLAAPSPDLSGSARVAQGSSAPEGPRDRNGRSARVDEAP